MCRTCGGGWSGDSLNAECEGLENLSTAEVHVKRFKHQDVSHEETLSFPFEDGALKLFDLPRVHRGDAAAERNQMPDEEEKRRRNKVRRSKAEKYFQSMSGDFIYRRSRSTSINIVRAHKEHTEIRPRDEADASS